MANPFTTIWLTFSLLARKITARTWQVVALIIGLCYFSWTFICVHRINRSEVLYQIKQEKGYTLEGSAKINIAINNGLLFEMDSMPHSSIETHYLIDNEQTANNVNFVSPATDTLMRKFYPDSIINGFKHIFTTQYEERLYSRSAKHNVKLTAPLHYQDSMLALMLHTPTIQASKHGFSLYKHRTTVNSIIVPLQYEDNEVNFWTDFTSSTLSTFPSILSPWDISQKTYRIQYKSDGVKVTNNGIIGYTSNDKWNPTTPLTEFKVDFLGPVELLPMTPEPDIVSMTGFEFTDSLKLQQIMLNGLEFHAKFRQTESLQSARTFFLTVIISFLFTLLCTLCYRIINRHWRNYRRGRKTK